MRGSRKIIKGIAVSSGIAIGRTRVILPGEIQVEELVVAASRAQAELDQLDRAVADTIAELRTLRETAAKRMASPVAKVFDAQLLIAGDYEFLKQVKEEIVSQRRNAGYVYHSLIEKTVMPLRNSSDHYMRQMAVEIETVAGRVLSRLGQSSATEAPVFPGDTVLVGKMFTPGQVMTFHHQKAQGFLIGEGGRNSHMALIARSLMVPIVLADDIWREIPNDCRIIIDGTTGVAIINPSDDDCAEYQKRRKRHGPATITRLRKLTQIPPLTADGKPISVAANLELPGPVDDILAAQKIPVGLYRTEFLYLETDDFPDEEVQYEYYAQIAERFAGSSVILRTFDIGSDKLKPESPWGSEDNPALGWRGIRSMLDMTDVFKAQIRAMLRASVHRNLSIMLPMVSDVSELEKARKLIGQVMLELRRRQVPFDAEISLGIMVEVPSAALMAGELAQKADFISIGSNDLTQYTMSADRNNTRVSGLYSAYHPAVLQLIKMTVDACKRHRKPVSICGEVAGDQLALPLFIGMGVDQVSMNPSKIFDMCRLVKRIDSAMVRHLVSSVMASSSAASVTRRLQSYLATLD